MKGLHIEPLFQGYTIQVFLSAVPYSSEENVPARCTLCVEVFKYTNVRKAARVSQVWKIRFLRLAIPNPPRISKPGYGKELFSKVYLENTVDMHVYGILTHLYLILSFLYID